MPTRPSLVTTVKALLEAQREQAAIIDALMLALIKQLEQARN